MNEKIEDRGFLINLFQYDELKDQGVFVSIFTRSIIVLFLLIILFFIIILVISAIIFQILVLILIPKPVNYFFLKLCVDQNEFDSCKNLNDFCKTINYDKTVDSKIFFEQNVTFNNPYLGLINNTYWFSLTLNQSTQYPLGLPYINYYSSIIINKILGVKYSMNISFDIFNTKMFTGTNTSGDLYINYNNNGRIGKREYFQVCNAN
jgi:hypothetical protein